MGTRAKGFFRAAGILVSILAGAAPALAQSHGGGGHGGGGGGHASGSGHSSGGGHTSGGGHFGGGGGTHYAAAGHYAGGAGYSRSYGAGVRGSTYAGYRGGYGTTYGHSGGYYGHSAYYYGGGHGYSTGTYWQGGYWHGGFWPRCYYGVGFTWFLPVLPLAYATYWWGGVPYYYANDVYYTYNPDYEGYVATDPPPVTESGADGAGPAAGPPSSDGGAAGGQIFMYPKNGQSAEQQATDRADCQQWAQQQAGQVAQNGSDYRRAMVACAEGRGYSTR